MCVSRPKSSKVRKIDSCNDGFGFSSLSFVVLSSRISIAPFLITLLHAPLVFLYACLVQHRRRARRRERETCHLKEACWLSGWCWNVLVLYNCMVLRRDASCGARFQAHVNLIAATSAPFSSGPTCTGRPWAAGAFGSVRTKWAPRHWPWQPSTPGTFLCWLHPSPCFSTRSRPLRARRQTQRNRQATLYAIRTQQRAEEKVMLPYRSLACPEKPPRQRRRLNG